MLSVLRVAPRATQDGIGPAFEFGILAAVNTMDGVRETDFDQDNAGNREAVSSPNFGEVTFAHTALGELRTRTDAKSQTTTYGYNRLGRLLSATDGAGTSRWTYDPTHGKSFLKQRCWAPRPSHLRLPGGRPPEHRRLPVRLTVRRTHHTQSYLSGSVSHADSARLETYGARDAYANVNSGTYGHEAGSVVTTTRTFEPGSGWVTGIETEHGSTTIQDHGSRTATAAPVPEALRSATIEQHAQHAEPRRCRQRHALRPRQRRGPLHRLGRTQPARHGDGGRQRRHGYTERARSSATVPPPPATTASRASATVRRNVTKRPFTPAAATRNCASPVPTSAR